MVYLTMVKIRVRDDKHYLLPYHPSFPRNFPFWSYTTHFHTQPLVTIQIANEQAWFRLAAAQVEHSLRILSIYFFQYQRPTNTCSYCSRFSALSWDYHCIPRTKSDVCLPHWLLGSLAAAFSSGDNSSWS